MTDVFIKKTKKKQKLRLYGKERDKLQQISITLIKYRLKKYTCGSVFLTASLHYLGLNIYRTRSVVGTRRPAGRFGTRPRTVTACTPRHG